MAKFPGFEDVDRWMWQFKPSWTSNVIGWWYDEPSIQGTEQEAIRDIQRTVRHRYAKPVWIEVKL